MPNTDFELHITGVSLCYYEPPYWNVIFPCNEDHQAVFSQAGKPSQSLREPGAVIKVEFPIANLKPNNTPDSPFPFLKLYNLSDNLYAHGTRKDPASGAVKSNLNQFDLTRAHPNGIFYDFVHLRIPYATRYVATKTRCDYYSQDLVKPGLPPFIVPHPVGRELIFRFVTTENVELPVVDLRNPSASKPAHPFPTISSGYVLAIDNDCHGGGCPQENDFFHLYRIVYDVASPDRQFAAGQVRCSASADPTTEEKTPELMAIALTSTHGNCDPIESNPPPGP